MSSRTATVTPRQCPKCKAPALFRTRTHGLLERMRRLVDRRRLYACRACGSRVWAHKHILVTARDGGWPLNVVAPDFAKIDAALKDDR